MPPVPPPCSSSVGGSSWRSTRCPELAKDAGLPAEPPKSGEFSIGHVVARRDDVDTVLAQARAAGATVLGEPHDRPWGIYSGYFQDPDGHLWEVIFNPAPDSVAG